MQPLTRYHELYDVVQRRFATPTTADPPLWQAWRTAFVAQLRARLALDTPTPATIDVQAKPPTTHPGYHRQYITLTSAPGEPLPMWLLVPEGATAARPAVIAVHGHGYGVDDIVGINADGSERNEPVNYHKDFAVALCRRGFVVLAPELLGFGRRREASDAGVSPEQSSCYDAALWGMMLGQPLLGRRVADIMRALHYLATRPEVDQAQIGIMGISGGGMVALFAAALDERLRAIVISGYLSTFRDSILAIRHCLCNYVPGLLADAEMYDVAALLAPRPLLIEAGIHDPIFPIAAVRDSFARIGRTYALLGAEERLGSDFFDGAHQISGALAYDFLWNWLHRTT
ncbi:MAG: acetylxylan esterase [Chloroflexales bacterium]|nr:acetylxylan esterase [Chloroflexales bacterium]